IRFVKGAQTHNGPGGLRSRARALAFKDGIVVGIAALTPAAILALDALKPVPRPEQPRLSHVEVERAQAAQHLPRPIDVIDAPASIPRSVLFLALTDEAQGFLHLGMLEAVALVAEQFQDSRGNVG